MHPALDGRMVVAAAGPGAAQPVDQGVLRQGRALRTFRSPCCPRRRSRRPLRPFPPGAGLARDRAAGVDRHERRARNGEIGGPGERTPWPVDRQMHCAGRARVHPFRRRELVLGPDGTVDEQHIRAIPRCAHRGRAAASRLGKRLAAPAPRIRIGNGEGGGRGLACGRHPDQRARSSWPNWSAALERSVSIPIPMHAAVPQEMCRLLFTVVPRARSPAGGCVRPVAYACPRALVAMAGRITRASDRHRPPGSGR